MRETRFGEPCHRGEGVNDLSLGDVAEGEFEVAGDIVDDGLGFGDFGVACVAHRLEAHALEAFDGFFDGEAVLHGDTEGSAEGLAHAGECGAFFGDFEEDFAGRAIGVEADGEVALVPIDAELVGDRLAGGRQALAVGDHP